jgi:hypothetical protein
MDFGPIPVDSEQEKNESNVGFASKINAQECMIDNTSSFWIAKGFCDGAQEVIRGGIGVKRTKKPVVSICILLSRAASFCLGKLTRSRVMLAMPPLRDVRAAYTNLISLKSRLM